MKMKGLQYDAGEDIRIQRTEIQNLPPYPLNIYHCHTCKKYKKKVSSFNTVYIYCEYLVLLGYLFFKSIVFQIHCHALNHNDKNC